MIKDELLEWAESLKGKKQSDYIESSDANKVRSKAELLKWFESLEGRGLPRYIEVSDANYSQVCFEGKWRTMLYAWSLFFAGGKWKYVETDDERGYVWGIKEFDDEVSAVKFVKSHLNTRYLANLENKSDKALLCRYIQKNYNCSEKQARTLVWQIMRYKDIFKEFFNYACIAEFCNDEGEQTEVCGYTAEILNRDYKMSPLEAYLFLVRLKKDPEKALAELKADK